MKLAVKSACLLFFWFALSVFLPAEQVAQQRPTGYVNDFAGVLDQNTRTQLEGICQQVDSKAHAQIAVVTIKSLDGADIFDYSVNLYQKWGVGKKGTDRGVLILLAVQDRKYYTTVGYGLEGILPDGKVGGFGREAVPLLKQGDYGGALTLMTSRVADVIAQDAGVQLNYTRPEAPRAPPERPDAGMSLGTMIFWGIVLLVVLLTPLRRVLFWFLLFGGGGGRGEYSGGSSGGWGGGGFGGGGGGFGGFGGGSTGGGGAGGSW